MKKHINLMQNPNDIQYDRYSEEYLIQALANLGQRIGIKGDGIAYKSFNFNDILSYTYDPDKYVGYIKYNKNDQNNLITASFGVANKTNLSDFTELDDTKNINDVLYFESDLSFSVPISNIEKFSKNSICINDENELTLMLIGKKIGYEDDEANNSILMYYKFDINTNKLICCYKLSYFFTSDNGDNYYTLLNITNTNDIDKYKFNLRLFNSKVLDAEYKSSFEALFNFHNYSTGNKIMFSIVDEEYVDLYELLTYYDNKENIDFINNSAISIILNNNENNTLYNNSLLNYNSFNLKLNTSKNELLFLDSELDQNTCEELISILENEYSPLNINEELFYVNEEINNLYVNIFKYYNEKKYFSSKKNLIKNILLKIYERSIDYKQTLDKFLYIPLNYEFHYICNSNNELNIYYSNNIYVAYLNLDNVNLEKFWAVNNNLVFNYSELDKLKVYNFEINYNKLVDELINSISIKDIYTMPYINANNNWSVNDSDTSIKAVGKDAGNPNIIIIYNHDKLNAGEQNTSQKYSLLSTLSNNEQILQTEFEQRSFIVNNVLFDNLQNIDIECYAWIPKITVDNYEYFKDSIILGISDLKCLQYESYQTKYKGSYIFTLWHIVENNNSLEFDYIKHTDSNYALTLGSTVNILNELSDSSVGNLNSYDLLLLKGIISDVAQKSLDINNNNWLIIKNKQSEEYSGAYNNDLNTILQYDDKINLEQDHVTHSHSDNRYIQDINNVPITNNLYPVYTYATNNITKTSDIEVLKTVIKPSIKRSSKITINGKVITDVESLIEKLEEQTDTVTQTFTENIVEESASLSKLNNNYNEYIFDSNVPTIDFKEIFSRNFNLLNRLNLISIDNNGQLYNAYIGTSYNESNKNVLHIGTSELNINVGSDTLMKEVDKRKFNKHDTLSLDFDKLILNSKDITIKSPIKHTYNINNYNCNIFDINMIDHNNHIMLSTFNDSYVISQNTGSLFAKLTKLDDQNNKVISYYICVNNLFNNEFNINLSNYSVNIKLNNDSEILTVEYNSNIYYFVKINDNNLININENNNGITYSSDIIRVMYFISSDNNSNSNIINICLSFK